MFPAVRGRGVLGHGQPVVDVCLHQEPIILRLTAQRHGPHVRTSTIALERDDRAAHAAAASAARRSAVGQDDVHAGEGPQRGRRGQRGAKRRLDHDPSQDLGAGQAPELQQTQLLGRAAASLVALPKAAGVQRQREGPGTHAGRPLRDMRQSQQAREAASMHACEVHCRGRRAQSVGAGAEVPVPDVDDGAVRLPHDHTGAFAQLGAHILDLHVELSQEDAGPGQQRALLAAAVRLQGLGEGPHLAEGVRMELRIGLLESKEVLGVE
mmetsp:Transcript_9895/g.34774  ORF Transcript_9895/g.34774 Transcript_9895/m.34774 type:complete len:267 (-) Transcript_9895:271-1071(-)